jgi:hypothetical protein
VGDLIYADTTTSLAKLADVAVGNALISGGVGSAPSYGKIGLATHVSGTLPVANGGTGVTSSTGSGSNVLSDSPTLVTPALGTPSALVGTNITGTASSLTAGNATTLATGRTIAITGDLAYTSPSFNGSGNVTAAGTLATVNSNVGSFTVASITVNAKGLITAASSGSAPAPTTAQVASAYAGIAALDVGSYSSLMNTSTSNVAVGGTIAGSNLRHTFDANTAPFGGNPYSNASRDNAAYAGGGTAPSGTWRAMAYSKGRGGPNGKTYYWAPSLFLRIS